MSVHQKIVNTYLSIRKCQKIGHLLFTSTIHGTNEMMPPQFLTLGSWILLQQEYMILLVHAAILSSGDLDKGYEDGNGDKRSTT